MKQTLILFIFVFWASSVLCQSPEPSFNKDDENLGLFLSGDIVEKGREKFNISNLCKRSATFAKFIVDSTGRISTISFTKNSPKAINDFMEYLIRAADDTVWVPAKINGKTVSKQIFVFPLIYSLESRCAINGIKREADSFHNIMDFDDGTYGDLDCVLLGSLYIFSSEGRSSYPFGKDTIKEPL